MSDNDKLLFKKGKAYLRLISSGTKIWNQLMMFLVVGVLPFLFPNLIVVENRLIVFVDVSLALITSMIFELWYRQLRKKRKSVVNLLHIQLITSVVLLTIFLHYFGRINGPFFMLYLLTVMESFLNGNILISNVVVITMICATFIEFGYLTQIGEIKMSLMSVLNFIIRIISLIFMRAYGFALAHKIVSEQRAKSKAQEVARQLEETSIKLKQANMKLRDLDKRKDEFISVAAHELRAPLTAVKGYLSMIAEGDVGKINKQMEGFIEGALEGADREINLVNNMLDVNRIEENRFIFNWGKVDLSEVVRFVYDEFKVQAKEKGLDFDIYIKNKVKDKVYVDKDRIYEVVGNLISNAIKYTDKGEVKIKLFNVNDDKILRFEIVDTGYGISEEEQKKLFTKFFRAESSSGRVLGTGLGLYIIKLLVDKFGGKLGCESSLRKGSLFWFELPVK